MKSARRSEVLGHESNYPDIYSDAPGASAYSKSRWLYEEPQMAPQMRKCRDIENEPIYTPR